MSDDLYAGDDSSGLLTHFVGRVKTGLWSNFFAETQGKATGDYAQNTLLFWHCDVLDILQANYEASGAPLESMLVSFGIGNGWHQDPSNPDLVEHEDDTPDFQKKFHANSNFMKFVYLISGQTSTYENAIVLDGDGDLAQPDLQGVRAIHAKNGVKTLRDATIWNNHIYEFRGLGFKSKMVDTPRARALPVRFMGYDESELPDISAVQETSTNNSTSGTSGGLGTPESWQVEAWTGAGASGPTIALLTKLYESSPTLEHFTNNAKMLPGVKDNDALAAVVATTEPSN